MNEKEEKEENERKKIVRGFLYATNGPIWLLLDMSNRRIEQSALARTNHIGSQSISEFVCLHSCG